MHADYDSSDDETWDSYDVPVCFYCKKKGHIKRNCRAFKADCESYQLDKERVLAYRKKKQAEEKPKVEEPAVKVEKKVDSCKSVCKVSEDFPSLSVWGETKKASKIDLDLFSVSTRATSPARTEASQISTVKTLNKKKAPVKRSIVITGTKPEKIPVCVRCGKKGHWTGDHNRACWTCGGVGHTKYECPNNRGKEFYGKNPHKKGVVLKGKDY